MIEAFVKIPNGDEFYIKLPEAPSRGDFISVTHPVTEKTAHYYVRRITWLMSYDHHVEIGPHTDEIFVDEGKALFRRLDIFCDYPSLLPVD